MEKKEPEPITPNEPAPLAKMITPLDDIPPGTFDWLFGTLEELDEES